ncbi:transmembrane protein 223-domain-containing protein [Powellomyces hirtus]|nr:transmembrane protein 223-domain-containing protein [Powellomyces hirtus]
MSFLPSHLRATIVRFPTRLQMRTKFTHPQAGNANTPTTAAPPPPKFNSMRNNMVLYENGDQQFYRVAYFCAGGQLLMWLTFADWAYRDLQTATGNVDENGRKEYVLAPLNERRLWGSFCLGIGGLLAAAVHLYTSSRIRAVTLLRGGQYVGIDTANLLGRNQIVLPTQSIKTFHPVVQSSASTARPGATSGYLVVKSTSRNTAYMLDRSGEFTDPKLFDRLFYKPK